MKYTLRRVIMTVIVMVISDYFIGGPTPLVTE